MVCVAASALLASCASTPDVSLARRSGVPSAPRWQGAGAVDVTAGSTSETPAATWLVTPYPASTSTGPGGNARPDWIVYRFGGASTSQVTPPGVVVRGGVAVSALSEQVAWVGMGSYRFDLDGNVAVTTDGGRRWSQNVLPYPYRPTPDGILATSPEDAAVLAGTGDRQVLVQSTDGGVIWHELASADELLGPWVGSCSLEGLTRGVDGALVLGSRCRSGTGVIVVRTATGVVERFTVAPPPGGGASASVTSAPQPNAPAPPPRSSASGRPARALVDVTWSKQLGRGQLTGVVAVPVTAGSASAGSASADSLPLDGTVADIPAGYRAVSMTASGVGGPQALLLAAGPTNWSHLGPVQLWVRGAPGESWTSAAVDDAGGHPDALAWAETSASGGRPISSTGLATLVATGSTAAGAPAAWTVSLGFAAAGAGPPQARWQAVSLAVPQVPTAKSLS